MYREIGQCMGSDTAKTSEIEPNVDLVEIGERKFFIVGTAHISQKSVELVADSIRRFKPDVVCVELCEARQQTLLNPTAWREANIFNIIRQGKAYLLMAQLALSSFQKRIGKTLGVSPGDEMRRAIEVAEEVGASVEVVDRDVKITLKRAWGNASIISMFKLFSGLFFSLFSSNKVESEEIERLKEGDMLSEVMEEFSSYLPGLKEVLIDERDKYMAHKIFATSSKTALAVVGAGHVRGIKSTLGKQVDLKTLESIPPPRRALQVFAWGVPLLIIGLIAYGFYATDSDTSRSMMDAWVLANGSFAALGALFTLAHPLTILTAFIAAPFTSLNPMIAAGWVCGLVEAFVRQPKVGDLDNIAEDLTSAKGIWQNRVTRILLVIVCVNIGSTLGTFFGIAWITSLLS